MSTVAQSASSLFFAGYQSGVYWLGSVGSSYQVFCDMSGAGVSLGGDGSTSVTSSATCENIKTNFGKITNGYYWLNVTSTPAQYICAMSVGSGVVMLDGSSSTLAAESCAQIIQYYTNRTSGIYNLKNVGVVYCDFTVMPGVFTVMQGARHQQGSDFHALVVYLSWL